MSEPSLPHMLSKTEINYYDINTPNVHPILNHGISNIHANIGSPLGSIAPTPSKGPIIRDEEETLETNAEAGWDADSLADALGLSQDLRQHELIQRALEVLKTSHVNPAKVNTVAQRKRQDYNCGKCGKRKKGHDCDGTETTPQEPSPSPKRRKYKPLQPLLIDNTDPHTQSNLEVLATVNANTVTIRLRISNEGQPPEYEVIVEASFGQRQTFMYIGKLSSDYKNLVRSAIEDNSITKVQLEPLKQVQAPDGRLLWNTTLSIHRTQSWHTKKLTELSQI
eukprot:TRINITY_DN1530_c0_g1_i3.p1 TRINITY_DN1530_c0_g1~~TRINITY_DN1530_c0_g1_i3.p1  ORF type:complete len:280 (-),score=33.07 TRINITY_DN1530_c0_g1_i3:32-871(-)